MTPHSPTLSLPLTADDAAATAPRPRLARGAMHTARIALGLVFFVFGLNGFLLFIPGPTEPLPEAAMAFTGGMYAAGYFFPLLAGTQVVSGALLLTNRLVPLALTVLAPVVLNIVLFHLFVWRNGLGMALVILALEAGLAWAHRDAFRGVLAWRR